MANSTTNVIAGKPLATGGALNAPVGTALPTDETTALNAAFKGVGYISSDGAKLTPNRSTDTKKAWGGDTVLALQTDFGVEVKVTLIEALNAQALKTAFGSGNVAVTAATATAGNKSVVKINAAELDHLTWVFEIKNGLKRQRIVLPDAQVTGVDEISWTDDDTVGYALTLTCFPDADGNYGYIYADDGQKTITGP